MFSQWLFFLDDEYDDHPTIGRDPGAVHKLMTLVFDVLDTGTLPAKATPFLRFTVGVRRRLDALAAPGWTARFLRHVEDYLFRGSLRAVEYWARDRVPTLEEYLHVRRLDSAVFPALDMSELAGGLCLPNAVREHPMLVEMKDLAVRYIAYVNDLFSYQKEVLAAGTSFNLVSVLMHENASSFEEAVKAATGIIGDAMASFSRLEQSLPAWDASVDPQVKAYIAGMKSWMRGSFDFSLTSARYNAPDSPFPELRARPQASSFPALPRPPASSLPGSASGARRGGPTPSRRAAPSPRAPRLLRRGGLSARRATTPRFQSAARPRACALPG